MTDSIAKVIEEMRDPDYVFDATAHDILAWADRLAALDGEAKALVTAAKNLTIAVRGFADGDMSGEVRNRLFLSRYDGPEQATFGNMCIAGDALESALMPFKETP